MTRGVLALVAVIALGAGACGATEPDPDVRRGRELLARGEADAAVRELRNAVQRRPGTRAAKGLLLVALLRSEQALPAWYDAQIMFERLRALRSSALRSLDGVQRIERTATRIRQELYDKGLDTRDVDELWDVTGAAAAYSRAAKEATDEERDHAAFVLALHGDAAATAYLVGRLKSERAAYLPGLLARLPAVDGALVALVAQRENLGRGRALDTLARLRERQAAESFFAEVPALDGVRARQLPDALAAAWRPDDHDGLTRDQALYGMPLHGAGDEAAAPLRARWATLDDDGATRLLILQGFDGDAKQRATRAYRFEAGRMVPLGLDAPAAVARQLAVEGPVDAIEVEAGALHLVQLGEGAVPVPREVTRARFARGDRVRVRSIDRTGVVAGTDEFGLVSVTLDEPHRGLRTMALTAGALRGFDTVLEPRVGRRRIPATVGTTQLTLAPAGDELLPLDGSETP